MGEILAKRQGKRKEQGKDGRVMEDVEKENPQ